MNALLAWGAGYVATKIGLQYPPRPMINALARLGGVPAGELPQSFEAHCIKQSQSRLMGLFANPQRGQSTGSGQMP